MQLLADDPDAGPVGAPAPAGERTEIGSEHRHRALGRCHQAGDDREQRGLARTAGAHERDPFTGRNREVDAGERIHAPVTDRDAGERHDPFGIGVGWWDGAPGLSG